MKLCPVCFGEFAENTTTRDYLKCTKCGNRVPRAAVMDKSAPAHEPGIRLYPDNDSGEFIIVCVMAAAAAAGLASWVTPSVAGPEFLLAYIIFVMGAFGIGFIIGPYFAHNNAGRILAFVATMSAGITRIIIGNMNGMTRFSDLILIMVVIYVIAFVKFESRDGPNNGYFGCGNSCGGSCGSGCGGGGCGGCGGS